jgi:DNA-binding PadR family transcriptional regulator
VKVAKDLVAASTVPLVLSILERGESYGYALIREAHELSRGGLEWDEGMLYPVLHWLEEKRHISSQWRVGETGRKRKYYSLRASGKKLLAEQKEQWIKVDETLRRSWRVAHA